MQKKLINIIHIKITVSFMIYHLIFLQSILNRNVSTFIHFGWLSNAVPFTWLSTLPNNSIFAVMAVFLVAFDAVFQQWPFYQKKGT